MEFLGYSIDRCAFTIQVQGVPNEGYRRELLEILPEDKLRVYVNKNKKSGGREYWESILDPKLGNKDNKNSQGRIFWLAFDLKYPYIVRGYFNPIYYWRYINKKYSSDGLHGTNFIDEELGKKRFSLSLAHFNMCIDIALKRAQTVFREYFNFVCKPRDVIIRFHSIEITEEYIGHVSQFSEAITRSRGIKQDKFSDMTQTHYINDWAKDRQFKIYQKTGRMARVEWTFNNEYAENLASARKDPKEMMDRIKFLVVEAKRILNFNDALIEELTPTSWFHNLCKQLKLEPVEFYSVMHASSFQSTRGNRNFRNKLVRRGLLTKVEKKRGLYLPTSYLLSIKKQFHEMEKISKIDWNLVRSIDVNEELRL